MKNIADLKNKYAGQTCWIVGKGPSLAQIKKEDFGDGPVITLNDSVVNIQRLDLPNKIFSMQRDGIEIPPEKYDLLIYKNSDRLGYGDFPNTYILDEDDFFLESMFSGKGAILLAKYMGCTKIMMMCFDACTTGEFTTLVVDDLQNQTTNNYLLSCEYMNNLLTQFRMDHEWITPVGLPIWKKYCVGKGIEIGGSSYRRFDLDTINLDDNISERYKVYEDVQMQQRGEVLPVDITADATQIPFKDKHFDFLIASHVLEHVFDPIGTLLEWLRVVKKGGIVFLIIPHKERTFDKDEERTQLKHLVIDYLSKEIKPRGDLDHQHFWITQDIIAMLDWMRENIKISFNIAETEDIDSHSGDGFTIVIRKTS